MELKSYRGWQVIRGVEGSNCTFMELKYRYYDLKRHPDSCSNCTFMELKYVLVDVEKWRSGVLIVPLWN